MKMARQRVERLLTQMDAVWGREGWVVGAEIALAGLGATQAAWVPGPGRHTIWQTVSHLAFWKEVCAGALTGAPRRPGPIVNSETFGLPGDPADEAAWQGALARLRAAHGALRAAVARLTDADRGRRRQGRAVAPRGSRQGTGHEAIGTGGVVGWEGEGSPGRPESSASWAFR
ncbi:MAG: DinB family protein [Firmicutes bacterium]|nr:DinB family protein [Bacillota bacterium]